VLENCFEPVGKGGWPPISTWIKDFKGSYIFFEENNFIEVEVVDEHPPPNFNPPLTELGTPLLVHVREIHSETFSLFIRAPTMSKPGVSSSVVEPKSPSPSRIGEIPSGSSQ
jgi:hypothetical protein